MELTYDNLITIHEKVQSTFQVESGVKDPGIVQGIADRPQTKLYEDYEPYNTIFLKAASIMEGIIRMHPFIDGNKRTALLAVHVYMEINGYSIVYPLSAVRYTVKMAENTANDPESTKLLIEEIASWIEKLSSKNSVVAFFKTWRYYTMPIFGVLLLLVFGQGRKAENLIGDWMAFDSYPEYRKEFTNVWRFFLDMVAGKYSGILSLEKK